MQIKTLCKNDWVSLRKIESEPDSIHGYVYSHETRCNGHIISILPYRIRNSKMELLFRYETTPCWNIRLGDLNAITISSITGGWEKNKHKSVKDTVIEEMQEEAGYTIKKSELINLGQCFGTKSCDTIYHLFSVKITDNTPFNKDSATGDGSELEKKAFCKWKSTAELIDGMDPFLYVSYVRLLNYLKINKL